MYETGIGGKNRTQHALLQMLQFSQLTLFIKESDYFYGNFNYRLWYWLLATDPSLPGRKDDGVDLFHRDVKILRQSCAFSLFYKQMFLLVNCYIKSFFTLDLKKSSLFYNKIKYIQINNKYFKLNLILVQFFCHRFFSQMQQKIRE